MPFLVYWLAWYLTTHQPRDSRYFCTCLENVLSNMPRAGITSLLQTMSENVVELAELAELVVNGLLVFLLNLKVDLSELGHTCYT